MAEFIIGIFSIIVCYSVGKNFSSKYSKRLVYYSEFEKFINYLIRNLKFKKENLQTAIEKFKTECKDLEYTLESALTSIYNDSISNDIFLPEWIEKCDLPFFNDFFKRIGSGCSQSELDFLIESQDMINEKQLKINDNYCKYSKLGQKLGLSFGVIVFILVL